MKILNNGEQFQLTFNSKDVVVPSGLSQDFPNNIAYHIQDIAIKWKKDIRLVDNAEKEKELLKEAEEKKIIIEEEIKEIKEESKVKDKK